MTRVPSRDRRRIRRFPEGNHQLSAAQSSDLRKGGIPFILGVTIDGYVLQIANRVLRRGGCLGRARGPLPANMDRTSKDDQRPDNKDRCSHFFLLSFLDSAVSANHFPAILPPTKAGLLNSWLQGRGACSMGYGGHARAARRQFSPRGAGGSNVRDSIGVRLGILNCALRWDALAGMWLLQSAIRTSPFRLR